MNRHFGSDYSDTDSYGPLLLLQKSKRIDYPQFCFDFYKTTNSIYQKTGLKSSLEPARIKAERLALMNAKEDKILNVEELSKFFGVSNQTIWRWCKAGKVPAFKIGSQWKIRQSDLNKIINQKLSKNKPENSVLF